MSARERFGVGPEATSDEVKAEWRRRAMALHPDRGGDAEEFTRVRRLYLAALDEAYAPQPCAACEGSGIRWKMRGWHQTTVVCEECLGRGTR